MMGALMFLVYIYPGIVAQDVLFCQEHSPYNHWVLGEGIRLLNLFLSMVTEGVFGCWEAYEAKIRLICK